MTFSVCECAEMVGNACESDVNSATAPSLGYDRLYVYLRSVPFALKSQSGLLHFPCFKRDRKW